MKLRDILIFEIEGTINKANGNFKYIVLLNRSLRIMYPCVDPMLNITKISVQRSVNFLQK